MKLDLMRTRRGVHDPSSAASRTFGQTGWSQSSATIDWASQDCVKDLPLWKSVDAENVTKNTRGIPQYPLVLLLQLDVLRVYELIINSPSCRLQYGRLPYVDRPRFLGAEGLERRLGGLPLDWAARHVG